MLLITTRANAFETHPNGTTQKTAILSVDSRPPAIRNHRLKKSSNRAAISTAEDFAFF
jgi:hypothetical protein